MTDTSFGGMDPDTFYAFWREHVAGHGMLCPACEKSLLVFGDLPNGIVHVVQCFVCETKFAFAYPNTWCSDETAGVDFYPTKKALTLNPSAERFIEPHPYAFGPGRPTITWDDLVVWLFPVSSRHTIQPPSTTTA